MHVVPVVPHLEVIRKDFATDWGGNSIEKFQLEFCPEKWLEFSLAIYHSEKIEKNMYRDGIKNGPVLLSISQARPGRKFWQHRYHFLAHLGSFHMQWNPN